MTEKTREERYSAWLESMKGSVCIGNGYTDCAKEATHVRSTQFSGTHPFCEQHALEEKDFMVSDSYTSWSKL